MLPKGKHVVLGLVTTKTGKLESKDDLKRRIDQAAKYCDLDQLCLSGQCGFASTEEGNTLTEDEQWAKLRLDCRGGERGLGMTGADELAAIRDAVRALCANFPGSTGVRSIVERAYPAEFVRALTGGRVSCCVDP